ncbi:MAG: 16S rRNA (adenine(1518)-N(6)/adenine(1519)-N(6))-dimethyltransferase [Bacteroidetes bacterium MED-G13]|nr:MAG: 16S rRNA (adenine(1518)-N(6)/adenine(1519)-N(6))-dimethyltransferase [Bacteroidetes bacterium MED-G13]
MNFVKPKKSLGQHFLTDKNVAKKITESLKPLTKNVLEIGPGTGILTSFLLKKKYNLILVEIDDESVAFLINSLLVDEKIIIKKDFLKLDLSAIFSGNNFSIIGNFPYNISSQILFKIIENKQFISDMCGMFQLEVAKRICEKPGTKVYGILSVLTQAYFETNFLFKVSKNLFYPAPNVESAVISLKRRENFYLKCNELLFFRVVKLSFQQRRKKVRNSLKTLNLSNNLREDAIFDKRPEQLSVNDFIKLTCSIENDI